MITVINDLVRVRGTKFDVEVETIMLLHDLYEHGRTKRDLIEMVELATMPDDELSKKAMDVIEKIISELSE